MSLCVPLENPKRFARTLCVSVDQCVQLLILFQAVLLLWICFVISGLCLSLPYRLSVSCSLVGSFWEMADLLDLLCVMFSCVYVTFPYGALGQLG